MFLNQLQYWKILKFFTIIAFSFISLTNYSEEKNKNKTLNSILVTVNGEAITLLDVINSTREKEARVMAVYPPNQIPEQLEKIRREAIERIIEDKIILSEFKSRSYKVPSQMIEKMLDMIATELTGGDRKQLEEFARKHNYSMEKLRKDAEERAAIDLMLNEFTSRHITVSPKEVNEYLKSAQEENNPEKIFELYAIFLKNEPEAEMQNKKDALIEKISNDLAQNNKNIFMTLARLYSEASSAQKGGYLGWIEEKRLRTEFAEALKNTEAGSSTGKINTNEGVYFLFISDIRQGSAENQNPRKITDFESAREELLAQKREKARKDFVGKLRKNAIIKYYY